MDLEPLPLPAAVPPPRRPSVPILAALVPVAGGIVLWVVTDSLLALCFAALGPMMLLASLLDSIRVGRRDRRRATVDEEDAWTRAAAALAQRHDDERSALRRASPDVAACLNDPPLRSTEPVDRSTRIVVGSGVVASRVRVTGGEGERAHLFRRRASSLDDAPITVALGGGICIRGPENIAAAVARAILVQLCLRHSPRGLSLVGEGIVREGLDGFPHARRYHGEGWTVAIERGDDKPTHADGRIHLCGVGDPPPEGITTVLDCTEPRRAQVRTTGDTWDLVVECLSREQAVAIAAAAPEQAEAPVLPDEVTASELRVPAAGPGLMAAIGRSASEQVAIDLVADGPHAIVTGRTGTGKSELLVTWITAMAATHAPDDVQFVLADFKGGTAFEALKVLPHVVAVITDLGDAEARRGVESLSAELRRREGVLVEHGVGDISAANGALPRLVIVVDEFAALLAAQPDLGAVFTDIAARGRALGMHLVLGTQRASGAIKDALAANCPLRMSLRVSDTVDSRAVIGTDDAALIPGGGASRGFAFVRRPQDDAPFAIRVALSGPQDIAGAAQRWESAISRASPWLPALPTRLALAELSRGETRPPGVLVVGRADEPNRQRQPTVTITAGEDRGLAVIGGRGSGKSAVIRLLAVQNRDTVVIGPDAEQAWDALTALIEGRPASLVLCDDLDLLLASYPHEHAREFLDMFERVARTGGGPHRTVVVTASRLTGGAQRVVEALPQRALLRLGSRAEHAAAGGDTEGFRADRQAGRAWIGSRDMQFAWVDERRSVVPRGVGQQPVPPDEDHWRPDQGICALLVAHPSSVAAAVRADHPTVRVLSVENAAADLLTGAPVVVVGDGAGWQRHWTVWQRMRASARIVVQAECATELRAVAGIREVPPYARPHAGRGWLLHEDRPLRRIHVPALDPRRRTAQAAPAQITADIGSRVSP